MCVNTEAVAGRLTGRTSSTPEHHHCLACAPLPHRQQVFNANQEATSLRLQLADLSQHDTEAAAVAAGELTSVRVLLEVKEKALVDSE